MPGLLVELVVHRLSVLAQPTRIRLLTELETRGEASVQILADDVGTT